MFAKDLYKGQHILITGGGSGLGLEMAHELASLGANLTLWGRRKNKLEQAASEISDKYGVKVRVDAVDIRSASDVQAIVKEVFQTQPLTGLINNAAGNFISRTEDISVNGFNAIANIVLHGTFYVTQAVGKEWIERKNKGRVISILTTWVWTGSPFVVASAMSKSGIKAMTQSLAAEWGRYGITLNAIAPGPFPTKGAWERLNPDSDSNESKGIDHTINPLGRVGNMQELRNLVAFLLAPGCDYLTGDTINIDGGQWLTGGGTFSSYGSMKDEDWNRVKDVIQTANEKDRKHRV